MAAFLAAERVGRPEQRILVVNPEGSARHIVQIQLRDALFAPAPSPHDAHGYAALAAQIAAHVAALDGVLGDLGVGVRAPWFGLRPVAARRFVGRIADIWRVHLALSEGEAGLMTGALGDPVVTVIGMGGVGKSLLAAEYALRFSPAYPGGVFWRLPCRSSSTSRGSSPRRSSARSHAHWIATASATSGSSTTFPKASATPSSIGGLRLGTTGGRC